MDIKIEFLFKYYSNDNLYYTVDYRVKNRDYNERNHILKDIKPLGMVCVIGHHDEKLA